MYTFTGDLDKYFLQHVGGVGDNSFINVLHTETNDDNEIFDQPQIISHSPYYQHACIILSQLYLKVRINLAF